MALLTEENSAEVVTAAFAGFSDARLRAVFESLVKHLHAFVRDVELTETEWGAAIDFLTRAGQTCDDKRQEFVLLSDVLGVSMLVDAINHRKPAGATESSVLGPFHRDGVPLSPMLANIAGSTAGEPLVVFGRVSGTGGAPLAGAVVDVWQAAPNGLYDSQDPEQDELNLRGRFQTGADGTYAFVSVKPASYPVPTDGPVGELLRAAGRHPWRPAHVHLVVEAPGHEPTTTSIFAAGDPYLESDAVFGVRESLIAAYRDAGPADAARFGLALPFACLEFDPVLAARPVAAAARR